MVPAASAAQGKPTSLYSLRKQLLTSYPREKKNPWNLTEVSVKLNILSVLSLNYILFNEKYRKNLEKFLSYLNCSTSRACFNTVKSPWVGCCSSVFPGSTDTHHCSSAPSFPLHPHSHMANFFHSITRTTTQLFRPTHYHASLSLYFHRTPTTQDRNC